jgi:hypothetical protein
MKKALVILILQMLVLTSFGSYKQYFEFEEDVISQEFSQLTSLENFVIANSGIDFNTAIVACDFSGSFANSSIAGDDDPFEFNLEGFLWGFLCCPVGFFIIPMNKQRSKDEMISFWIGYCSNTVIGTVLYTVMIVNAMNNATYY